MKSSRLLFSMALCATVLGAAVPCLWDNDTLAQERSRFPSALELITGKFPHHSQAYYRWRIADREARLLAGDKAPGVWDDLAVAHSKLGDDAKAIELMAEKESLHPGMYETEANRGTFYLHAGQLEEGVQHIARAIQINPEAHFGREIYQELLALYILEKRAGKKVTPLPLQVESISALSNPTFGYWDFLLKQRNVSKAGQEEELERAMRGVTGMLRFGNYDSPALLEAFSDLLLADRAKDGKRLAARALLQASYLVKSETTRATYRTKAKAALVTQTPAPGTNKNLPLVELEKAFAIELADGKQWWAELEARERYWIENGADVDDRFADIYYAVRSPIPDQGRQRYRAVSKYGLVAVGALGVVAVAYWALVARNGTRVRATRSSSRR